VLPAQSVHIRIDDLSDDRVRELLAEHLSDMHSLTPSEHIFALDVQRLRAPEITFFTAWDGETLLGCGALKELSPSHGELKSMRTPRALRGRGVGRAMLDHLLAEARQRGYARVSLETGTHPAFVPAQTLYRSAGFVPCGPFGDYRESPYNLFMTLTLSRAPD
jgi:putative acetyltransferase